MPPLDLTSTPALPLISDYVAHYAEHTPDIEATVVNDRRMTYRELNAKVDDCARALIQAGVGKGDRVATLSPPHPDFFVLFLASASIGAIWLGLNPRYKLDEFRYVLNDSRPKVLVARSLIGNRVYDEDLVTLVQESTNIERLIILNDDPLPQDAISYDRFITDARGVPPQDLADARSSVSPDDAALIVYTSGSTGQPKGALLPHRGLVKCSRIQRTYWDADPIRIVNFLPVNHIGCVGDISCYALVAGGTIIFMEQFHPAQSMELTVREGVTVWGGIPTTLQMCVDLAEFPTYDLSAVQVIAWSGAAAPGGLIDRLSEITPRLSNSYGLTETVGSVTYVYPCSDVGVLTETVGKPVPEFELRIADAEGRPLPIGEEGEIQVRGDFIMLGYWDRPDATSKTIEQDGWMHTGDVGALRPDGNLKLVGRLKDMYKSGGYNIYPREIETVLEECEGAAMAAVIGVADPLYGEVGHAYILQESGANLSVDELRAHCRNKLANYKIPKSIHIANELPMLPVGKIDKHKLKEMAHRALS